MNQVVGAAIPARRLVSWVVVLTKWEARRLWWTTLIWHSISALAIRFCHLLNTRSTGSVSSPLPSPSFTAVGHHERLAGHLPAVNRCLLHHPSQLTSRPSHTANQALIKQNKRCFRRPPRDGQMASATHPTGIGLSEKRSGRTSRLSTLTNASCRAQGGRKFDSQSRHSVVTVAPLSGISFCLWGVLVCIL
jgi:hypothetical protein